jgi:hypothetical protein
MAKTDSFIASFLKEYQSMMEQKVKQLQSKTISAKHPKYFHQTTKKSDEVIELL